MLDNKLNISRRLKIFLTFPFKISVLFSLKKVAFIWVHLVFLPFPFSNWIHSDQIEYNSIYQFLSHISQHDSIENKLQSNNHSENIFFRVGLWATHERIEWESAQRKKWARDYHTWNV